MRANRLVLAITTSVCLILTPPELAAQVASEASEVLLSRPAWRDVPESTLRAIAARLETPSRVREFAELCEQTGILQNNIRQIAGSGPADADYVLGMIAATLTSYGNGLGDQARFREAGRVLEFAVMLKPRHVPAWISLALVAVNTGDCRGAVQWADKVLNFKPDPNSDDEWERGAAAALTREGEKEAADALGEPDAIGAWQQMQQQMRLIKDHCSQQRD